MDLWLTGRIYCFLPFEASPVFIPVKVGGSEIFFFPLIQVFFFSPCIFSQEAQLAENPAACPRNVIYAWMLFSLGCLPCCFVLLTVDVKRSPSLVAA